MSSKKKVTLYLPPSIFEETREEALRQDRSVSWVLQMAWLVAREKLLEMPAPQDFTPDAEDSAA